MDAKTLGLFGGVLVVLAIASAVVRLLKRRVDGGLDPAIVETFRHRVWTWWLLLAPLAAALLAGKTLTVVLFGLIAFWALREFITLTPTRPGDHRALFWVFFLCTPLQFVLVGVNRDWFLRVFGVESYNVYSILIPVYAFLLIPARIALAGDSKRFLERTAKIQSGLLICVYCLSYTPALLNLQLPHDHPQPVGIQDSRQADGLALAASGQLDTYQPAPAQALVVDEHAVGLKMPHENAGRKVRLLFFFVLIAQLSDAFQYAWSQLPSRHVIVPAISPGRTWEGLLGSAASVTLVGTALWFATPFAYLWQVALISLIVSLTSFAGGLTMSAIKRDRGVKDYGTLIEGHGGVLDRIDSLCFSAPIFFHVTWLFLNVSGPG